MQVDFARKRVRRLSLTSLIDVIFLLLLFFMLSSTFTRFAEVEVRTGGNAGSQSTLPDVFIALRNGVQSINGSTIDTEQLSGRLAELKNGGAETAVLVVSEDTDSQHLIVTIEKIQESGLAVTVAR